MPFALDAIVAGTTYSLTDKNPFRLEDASGLGMTDVARLTERSPFQQGVSDLGYRVQARTVTLSILFTASSASALDTHRSTLTRMFQVSEDVPITLRVTRDDGTTRSLTCYTTGTGTLDLRPTDWPGNLHRAVVQLRAASPYWTGSTTTTTSIAPGTAAVSWWLANGAIGSANVMEYVESPGVSTAWTYGGTLTSTFTIAVRTEMVGGNTGQGLFQAGTATSALQFKGQGAAADEWYVDKLNTGVIVDLGTAVTNLAFVKVSSGILDIYSDGTYRKFVLTNGAITGGTPRYWRNASGVTWGKAVPKAAVYNIALSASQVSSLDYAMDGGWIGTGTVTNSGQINARPQILLVGPMQDPSIANTTTGKTLDLTGITLGTSETCLVDLRYSSVAVNGSVNWMGSISAPETLLNWWLEPAASSSGGTNVVTVNAMNVGTTTSVQIYVQPEYLGY